MKEIAFTGMPFSGKSEAVRIAKDKGIPVVRMGDMVWDETKKQGLSLNGENVGRIANDMREKYGKEIWAIKTIEKIKKISDSEKIVIDGVRNIEEIQAFKKNLGQDFVLVAVEASDELRYKRAMNRGREDDVMDINEIKKRDSREISWGIKKVIESADISISNEDNLESFRQEVSNVLNDLQKN